MSHAGGEAPPKHHGPLSFLWHCVRNCAGGALETTLQTNEGTRGRFTGITSTNKVLAGAKRQRFQDSYSHAHRQDIPPPFPGTIDEFVEKYPQCEKQMRNICKKCAPCNKVCAFTMKYCNQCGNLLPEESTFSPNVFSGFIYGVEKAGFKLKISIRKQTKRFIVFDDLLALSPCHLNVIPTDVYVKDWRFLLLDPPAGLQLLLELEKALWDCVSDQFLRLTKWRRKYMRLASDSEKDIEALRNDLILGLNFPPSQYQLHIQCIMPPFLPNQYKLYLDGVHMTKGRFFPLKYVKALLTLNDPMNIDDTTTVTEILDKYESRVSYEKMHAEVYEAAGRSHSRLANWREEDFSYQIEDVGSNANVFRDDKLTLQSYGRPYCDGAPGGAYYAHARATVMPERLSSR